VKRTCTFVKKIGTATFLTAEYGNIEIPLFPGILKHLCVEDLPKVVESRAALRKYTREALKTAPWPVLREFPPSWLCACLDDVQLREGRRRALEFLLSCTPVP
jgi:hypothetical protein